MTRTILGTSRYIYRCTNKSCGHTYALDFQTATRIFDTRRPSETATRLLDRPDWICPDHINDNPRLLSRCPKCQGFAKPARVDGRTSDTPCDHRCTSARGHNCECSCGGVNHGRDWLAKAV